MISQGLEKKGIRNMKEASKALGISPELLRVTLYKDHIPKDSTLSKIAIKLGMNNSALIMAAHQEKVPNELKGFFLSPSQSNFLSGKRVYPLSAEQCDYLSKAMEPEEIQMLRKFRQISDEEKRQIIGYVDYLFATKRDR